jgi:DNA helicase-4
MVGDAVRYVETGKYRSPFSLILVDEFQDTSEPRANLVKALKHQKPFNKLFAVGDDWQSIYRFAGSDVTIFTDFEAGFGASWVGRLELTYRCNQALADTAAAFVQRNPAQFQKRIVSTRPAVPRSIRIVPVKVNRGTPFFSEACREVLDRLNAFLGRQAGQWRTEERTRLKVLVLWRYNSLDPFRGHLPRFENIDVTGLSFHRSKGLEADYTILLDVSDGNYGVPSRIEDDELLNLVIPRPESYPFAEERRLFYVALTRASRGTFLLANHQCPSPFIRELVDIGGDDIQFETADGSPIDICRKCLVGTIANQLRNDGTTVRTCTTCGNVEATKAAVT